MKNNRQNSVLFRVSESGEQGVYRRVCPGARIYALRVAVAVTSECVRPCWGIRNPLGVIFPLVIVPPNRNITVWIIVAVTNPSPTAAFTN
jgi:hypothetical protein